MIPTLKVAKDNDNTNPTSNKDLDAETLLQKGCDLYESGRYPEAAECCDMGLEADPAHIGMLSLRGDIFAKLKKYQEAIGMYDRVLEEVGGEWNVDDRVAETLFRKGLVCFEMKDYEGAVKCCEKASRYKHHGGNRFDGSMRFGLLFLEAGAHAKLGKYEQAISRYDEILKTHSHEDVKTTPAHGETFFRKCLAHYELALESAKSPIETARGWGRTIYPDSEYQTVIECCDVGLEADPGHAGLLSLKGEALGKLGKYRPNNFGRVNAVHDGKVIYHGDLRGNKVRVPGEMVYRTDSWGNKIRVSGDDSVHMRGAYGEVLKCLDTGLEADPKNTGMLLHKGSVLYELGRHDEAAKCLQVGLDADPAHVGILMHKGLACYELGEYEDAMECCDRILWIDPKHIGVLVLKGDVLARLNRHSEAIEMYDKAWKVPGDGDSEDYDHKPKTLDDREVLLRKGLAYYELGEYQKSIGCCDEVFWYEKYHVEALLLSSDAHAKLGEHQETIRLCDKYLEIVPKNSRALFCKGLAYYELGLKDEDPRDKYGKAAECCNAGLKSDPGHAGMLSLRGDALSKLGKYQSSMQPPGTEEVLQRIAGKP